MATHLVIVKSLRRHSFILLAAAITALFLMQCNGIGDPAVFVLEPLPYAQDALAPTISADTMSFHYDKHYAGYVKKANARIKGQGFGGKTAEEIIRMTADDDAKAAVFNNAAQAWNHAYFFKCLKPQGGGAPEGRLAEMIDDSFGSFQAFKTAFKAAAVDQFGSGWAWLVLDGDQLALFAGANADTPLAHGLIPLFTMDVWEHAYYLDYQNRRADFVEAVLENLADWTFVAEQLAKALPEKE